MRLLLVEDESGIANFVKQGLEEEGYAVDWASDGDEGLDLALTGDYDLLILDWMVPGKSGIEICTQFRKLFPVVPVLFLTAKDTVKETIFGLQVGGNDYIKKPFHFDELLERIRVQLRPMAGGQPDLVLGPIAINRTAHKVTKNGEEIALTQKEFALLEMLVENKEQVCTRTRIIETVWDIHFDYNTSVIDVYINALRKKLMLTENENLIQTVRGIGYIAKEA